MKIDANNSKTLGSLDTPEQGLEVNVSKLAWHDAYNDRPTDPRKYVITDCFDVLSVAAFIPEQDRFDAPYEVTQWAIPVA
tara:strand:- start:7531 stop:7770 length:240 start_codon:yes stop_codon:yes gene_type:complete